MSESCYRGATEKDVALHRDNIQLWGENRMQHVPVVYSIMVQSPATYLLAGWTIQVHEGTELVFPQHMMHEVLARGLHVVRRNTTHRLWIPKEELEMALPKWIMSDTRKLQTQLDHTTRWMFWRLSEQDWVGGRQSANCHSQVDHFTYATNNFQRRES